MNSSATQKLDIQKVESSRIGKVDFRNLNFRKHF